MNEEMQSAELETKNNEQSALVASDILNADFRKALADSREIFIKSLQLGRVRGIVGVLGFTDSGSEEHTSLMQFVQDLISRDILVTISTRGPMTTEDAGMADTDFFQGTGEGLAEFCEFIGIRPATLLDDSNGAFNLTDFIDELSQYAELSTSELPVAVVKHDGHGDTATLPEPVLTMKNVTAKTVDRIDDYIHEKRINAQWCDRCGGRFSPFS